MTIQEDLKEFGLTEECVKNLSGYKFKQCLKIKLASAAFNYLINLKEGHSKGDNLTYKKLECQQYLL